MMNSIFPSANSRSRSRKSSFSLRRGTVLGRDLSGTEQSPRQTRSVVGRKLATTQSPGFDGERPHHGESLLNGRRNRQIVARLFAQAERTHRPLSSSAPSAASPF